MEPIAKMAPEPARFTLQLDQLRTDGGTQPRARLDESAIKEYADDMRGGATFPPVVVFYDGDQYWLVDGFHRVAAAKRVPQEEITADVFQGSRRDAVLYSVGVNATHGLRRTNDDKRRAVLVLLNDPEWATWSDREIARRCKVHHDTVSRHRKEIAPSLADSASQTTPRTYITRHGTPAQMDVSPIQDANQARAGGDSAEEPQVEFDHETIRIGSGPTDEGAWHRCIDIARRLRAADLWDGQQRLVIHDPYTLHNRLAGVEHLPVTHLVSGEHYEIVVSERTEPPQDGLADDLALTTHGDPDSPAPVANTESEQPPTPPRARSEGPGEAVDPVISDASHRFAEDAKISGDVLVALQAGPKSLIELSKATEVHPTRLLDVLPRLVTHRLLTKTTVPGGQARYALPDSPTPAGTPPVGKNGAGIPDSHNPEREAAIAAAARLERAALDVISAVERFTQLKGVRALHALDADRLTGVEQLLNQVVSQAAAANGHAVDLITKVRTMADTGQPYDEVSTP
jgi:hypothetical protein